MADESIDPLKRWYRIDLNPVPWAIGPIARRGPKSVFVARHEGLHQFKQGVKSALEEQNATMIEGSFKMKIFFWRRMEEYLNEKDRKARSHEADATNLQKALEDGCAKVLFPNDVENKWVESVLVEQNFTCDGKIIFSIEPVIDDQLQFATLEIPDFFMQPPDQLDLDIDKKYNSWPPQ